MSDDNFGPWIDWAANGQPPSDLASAIAYQAKDREGQIYTSTRLSEIYWGEIKDGTIIAYRVHLPADDLLRQAIDALRTWENIAQHCTISDGMCCCGDDMERHPSPMNCGHSATDHGGYQADLALKATSAVLASAAERGL